MSRMIKIKINNQEFTCPEGKTILEVVQENNLDSIPTLCHDKRLHPFGSCFVCVVEVKGVNKFVPSCCTPVTEGMEVVTNNKRITEVRRTALELLVSNHYADCLGPCKLRCPAGVDVQGYIALISEGKPHDAVRLIKETNPLPLVCGRVCVRECEIACRRNLVDERVGIDYLKRYAADIDRQSFWTPAVPAKNGMKVAVVGGGPAGLTAAYFLILKGYEVTIFDQMPALGGMLRYGIPEYRLPKAVLDAEINWIINLGVEVQLNRKLGKDFSLDSLKKQGFDAVLLAIGAWQAKGMRLKRENEISGVLAGIDFLRKAVLAEIKELKGRVVVVGGGNTAIDAARTALRLGADRVTILYRRTRKEMPAHDMEIQAALDEGVELIELAAPVELLDENRKLKGVRAIRMELGAPDASGRRSPVPREGSEFDLDCDWIISAIGQGVEINDLKSETELKLTRWETIQTDEREFCTTLTGVFAAGDAISGPAVAIDAIAHGKKAAEAIDRYLRPERSCSSGYSFLSRKETFGEVDRRDYLNYPHLKKEEMPEMPVAERIKSFKEVELGFSGEQAAAETRRCLECGCLDYYECKLREYASEYKVELKRFIGEVRKFEADRRHPYIVLDANKCISCSKCIRLCSEVMDITALGLVWRGFKSVMKPAGEKPLEQTTCISCGNCIDICPTGAIEEKLPFSKPGPWKFELRAGVCQKCSINCRFNYKVYSDELYSIAADVETYNQGLLCKKGRFSVYAEREKKRLLLPELTEKKKRSQIAWRDALQLVAEKTKKIINRYGAEALAVSACPELCLEELYLIEKLSSDVLGSLPVESYQAQKSLQLERKLLNELPEFISTCKLSDLESADLILTFNDFQEENLVAWVKCVQAQKRGARLINISAQSNSLQERAEIAFKMKTGCQDLLFSLIVAELLRRKDYEEIAGAKRLLQQLQFIRINKVLDACAISRQQFEELYRLILNAKKVVAVLSLENALPQIAITMVYNLLLLRNQLKSGSGLLLLSKFGNWEGLRQMRRLYYRRGAFLEKRLKENRVKILWLFEENPFEELKWQKLLEGVESVVYFGSHFPQAIDRELILIPWLPQTEKCGSLISTDLRWQSFKPVLKPKNEFSNLDTLKQLAAFLGADFNYHSCLEVLNEISEIHPLFFGLPAGQLESCRLDFYNLLG